MTPLRSLTIRYAASLEDGDPLRTQILGTLREADSRFSPGPEAFNVEEVQPSGTNLIYWTWEQPHRREPGRTQLRGIMYRGKSRKPVWNFVFLKEQDRDKRIRDTVENNRAQMKQKEETRRLRKEWQHGIQVGDIFVSSWGYDQTNVDFYQITKLKGLKQVEMRPIAGKIVGSRGESDRVTAVKGKFTGSAMRKTPQRDSNGKPYIKIASYASARPWDGKPRHQTSAYAGH